MQFYRSQSLRMTTGGAPADMQLYAVTEFVAFLTKIFFRQLIFKPALSGFQIVTFQWGVCTENGGMPDL